MIRQMLYKCRLCGECYSTSVQEVKDSMDLTTYMEFDANANSYSTMARAHRCADGSIGLADFQGYKVKE